MSFDIYSYHSSLEKPDSVEAQSIIEGNGSVFGNATFTESYKNKSIQILKECNPGLLAFEPSKQLSDSMDFVELNPPEEEPVIQITVFDDHVCFSIPYWYKGDEARNAMGRLKEYVDSLAKGLGYFVYDPQDGAVLNPLVNSFDKLDVYLSSTDTIESHIESEPRSPSKPWWKFWM